MSRKFTEMIFLGNGKHSMQKAQELHGRLDDGLSWLLAGQQGPADQRMKEGLQDVVRDIVSALGYDPDGLTWERLPYQGIPAPKETL